MLVATTTASGEATLDPGGVGFGEDLPAGPGYGAGQAGGVLERMELGLPREPERRTVLEVAQRGPGDPDHTRDSGPQHRVELLVERVAGCTRRGKEVTIHPLEVAVDVLQPNDPADPVHRLDVTPGRGLHSFGPVEPLQLVVAGIQDRGQVGGRAAGIATADGTVVQHCHRFAVAREEIGGGQPRNAGADDADVHLEVLGQRSRVGDRAGGRPERSPPGGERACGYRHAGVSARKKKKGAG